MKKIFSELVKKIERFIAGETQERLNADEKALMRTVLSDFKGSIESGRLDKFTERKHSLTYEVFTLEFYHDHLMYLKGNYHGGFEIKSLKYKSEDLNFERLKNELEKLGLKVQMSTYREHGSAPKPMHVFFTVPIQKAGS